MPAEGVPGDESPRCPHCLNAPCLLSQGLYRSMVDYYEENFCDADGETTLASREVRFQMYKYVTEWIHGFLGKGVRIKIPLCVQSEIRDLAPADPGTTYVGFKESREQQEG
jgi:hypothetical protein